MEATSVILPQKLGLKLRKKAEEIGYLPEEIAVKRIGAMRGLKLEQHGSLWDFISRLSRESRDKEIVRLFTVANGLHRNFMKHK